MQVTVVDAGDLPPGTFISFNTGTSRRHAPLEKDRVFHLATFQDLGEPVTVDVLTQVGSSSFDVNKGKDVYEVTLNPSGKAAGSSEVQLKLQVREPPAASPVGGASPGGASKKHQTALLMRSYLDNHDVLRQMQELLQDMVTLTPEDPVDYMIQRLEEICQEEQGLGFELQGKGDEVRPLRFLDEDDEEGLFTNLPPPPHRDHPFPVLPEAYDAFSEKQGEAAKPSAASEKAEGLKAKVAEDFEKSALVEPTKALAIANSRISAFGGLRQGQKFQNDSALNVLTELKPETIGEEELYSWQSASPLKNATALGVLCQKGQKFPSDPCPNQDNFYVHSVNGVTLLGVCDGHGPFGHLVSFRLVQSLPHHLSQSSSWGKDWEKAMKEAFHAAQEDLKSFASSNGININASGAAGSLVVVEGSNVHVACIGDAKVMLASWSKQDSKLIFCSQAHEPNLPAEKARLEANGLEVREVDPGSYRIYIKGTTLPGLTMSRAFGDLSCAPGVIQDPDYKKFTMQPDDQWYAIAASDGLWEFLSGQDVCNLSAKKLRLKGPQETLSFLASASRKRWAVACGEYCDDITGVLVQWNAPSQGAANHSLRVKRAS